MIKASQKETISDSGLSPTNESIANNNGGSSKAVTPTSNTQALLTKGLGFSNVMG